MKRVSKLKNYAEGEVNLTPMIDLIFLLLVFFIVTTSFTRDAGIDVKKPSAETAKSSESLTVMIGVDEFGSVFMDKKSVDVRSIRGRITALSAQNPELSVMVVADRRTDVESVVAVMDQCRLAGVEKVSLAAEKKY